MLPRWKWLRPFIERAHLWHWSRRTVAMGAAIGVFFGLLIPVAQIPASAVFAALLRANLPAAALGTLITNPLTTAPLYYVMYRLGRWILEHWGVPVTPAEDLRATVGEAGTALLIGVPVSATVVAGFTYLIVSLAWLLWVVHRRPGLMRRIRARSREQRAAMPLNS